VVHTAPHWLSTNAGQQLVNTAPHYLSTHAGQLMEHTALHSLSTLLVIYRKWCILHHSCYDVTRNLRVSGYHTLSECCVSLCESFREQKFTRNFPAISSNYTDSSHPSFSMKLIHRASSIFAAGLMTSQLHHSASWHCIILRLQRQLYLIARTTDETFCLAAKTLQKLQILSSLSLFLSIGLSQELPRNCQLWQSFSAC